VRVAADMRGQGIGAALIADAEARARAAGCRLLQLTSNASRLRARKFYEELGFTPSHIGYKRDLN
jgi:GNAT superfamily N-acetyltransferase